MHVSAGLAVTPTGWIEDAVIAIEGDRITSVSRRSEAGTVRQASDYGDAVLVPGYIDLHVHGGAGFDLMQADEHELAAFERFLFQHGVTGYLATTVTAPETATLHSLERLGRAVERSPEAGRAQLLGVHLEGPFISHAKRGVHPPEYLQPANTRLFDRFFDAAEGTIKMMTFAPELPNGAEFIRHAVERGVIVSLGHSNANWSEAQTGITAGASTATHTFNAMRALDHRDPGILGAVLTDSRLHADIICDGVHVHPEMVRLFLEAKGDELAILITDAISATGMGDGIFQLGSLQVEVTGDQCRNNGTLAGSVLTLDRAVRNAAKFAGWALPRAARLASQNPAALLGLSDRGVLAPGARADINVLDIDGNIREVIVGGMASGKSA